MLKALNELAANHKHGCVDASSRYTEALRNNHPLLEDVVPPAKGADVD